MRASELACVNSNYISRPYRIGKHVRVISTKRVRIIELQNMHALCSSIMHAGCRAKSIALYARHQMYG